MPADARHLTRGETASSPPFQAGRDPEQPSCWLQSEVYDVTIFGRLEMGGTTVKTTFDSRMRIIVAKLVLASG